MEAFEKQFDDMEVVTKTMEGTMDSSTASSTPAEEVDDLIRQVADLNNLDLDSSFDTAVVPKKIAQPGQYTVEILLHFLQRFKSPHPSFMP